jgi:hypothetical protein
MNQLGQRTKLAFEAMELVGAIGPEHLERDATALRVVNRLEDDAEAAASEPAHQLEALAPGKISGIAEQRGLRGALKQAIDALIQRGQRAERVRERAIDRPHGAHLNAKQAIVSGTT